MAGAGGRVDGVDGDPRPLQQSMDNGAFAGFDGNGDRPTTVLLIELVQPLMERFGGVVQSKGLGSLARRGDDDGVGLITPIQANEGGEFSWLMFVHCVVFDVVSHRLQVI